MTLGDANQKMIQTIHNFQLRWVVFNAEKKYVRWLPFVLMLSFTLLNLLQYITPQYYRDDPWLFAIYVIINIAMFYSTAFYWHDRSGYVMLGAILALTALTYFIWFFVFVVFLYYFYYWLDARRMKKLEKIAKTPPAKLAKISQEKLGPRVEVTVRTGGGGK
jgi:uncharacterized membrane protein